MAWPGGLPKSALFQYLACHSPHATDKAAHVLYSPTPGVSFWGNSGEELLGALCLASEKSAGTFPVTSGHWASSLLPAYSHFPAGCDSGIFPPVSYSFVF